MKAKDKGLISRFEACNGGDVTHLQFADDTIFFSSSRWEEIVALKRILRCLQIVSGLKINLSKSFVVGVGCSEENIQILVNRLHCRKDSLPFSVSRLAYWGEPEFHYGIRWWKSSRRSYPLGRDNIVFIRLTGVLCETQSAWVIPWAKIRSNDPMRQAKKGKSVGVRVQCFG